MCKLQVKYPSTVKYWHVTIEYSFFNPNISADKVIYLTSTWVKSHLEKKMLSKSLVSLGYWESECLWQRLPEVPQYLFSSPSLVREHGPLGKMLYSSALSVVV